MSWLKKPLFWIVIITGLGALLRLYNLTAIALWHDEAFSALLIKYSWWEMLRRIALDVHPPGYYVFLRLWYEIFGDSLLSLRGFSALFGIAIIPAAYGLVKTVFENEKAALITALLIAINPFQIQYVTEVRMYTFGAFFAIVAALALSKALKGQFSHSQKSAPSACNCWRWYYLLFTASLVIMIYTHYYLLFSAAALVLYGAFRLYKQFKFDKQSYFWLLLAVFLTGLAYIPWLPSLLFQVKQVGAGYWIPPMDRWSIPTTLTHLLTGKQDYSRLILILITLISIYAGYRILKKYGPNSWLIIFSVIAPFAGAILFYILALLKGQTSSVYLVRYFLFCAAFYSMLIALWLKQMRFKTMPIVLAIIIAINLSVYYQYWKGLDIANRPGMAIAKSVIPQIKSEDLVIVASSFQYFNLKYYAKDSSIQPLLYSGGKTLVSQMQHFEGTALLNDTDLFPRLDSVNKNQKIWLVWTTGFGGKKPATPANWQELNETKVSDVHPYVGAEIAFTEYLVR